MSEQEEDVLTETRKKPPRDDNGDGRWSLVIDQEESCADRFGRG